jgi:hypothetical protein
MMTYLEKLSRKLQRLEDKDANYTKNKIWIRFKKRQDKIYSDMSKDVVSSLKIKLFYEKDFEKRNEYERQILNISKNIKE